MSRRLAIARTAILVQKKKHAKMMDIYNYNLYQANTRAIGFIFITSPLALGNECDFLLLNN